MITLSALVKRPKKRVGRGHGSGKVKTSGRGTKGQKARGKIRAGFEGGQLPIIKRLPLLRGKSKNKSRYAMVVPISLDTLNRLPDTSVVTVDVLIKQHLIDSDSALVKILGDGTLMHAYQVHVPCSKSAARAIEKAGGKVVAS